MSVSRPIGSQQQSIGDGAIRRGTPHRMTRYSQVVRLPDQILCQEVTVGETRQAQPDSAARLADAHV